MLLIYKYYHYNNIYLKTNMAAIVNFIRITSDPNYDPPILTYFDKLKSDVYTSDYTQYFDSYILKLENTPNRNKIHDMNKNISVQAGTFYIFDCIKVFKYQSINGLGAFEYKFRYYLTDEEKYKTFISGFMDYLNCNVIKCLILNKTSIVKILRPKNSIHMYEHQKKAIDLIKQHYKTNNNKHCNILIYGASGIGKSTIIDLMVNELNDFTIVQGDCTCNIENYTTLQNYIVANNKTSSCPNNLLNVLFSFDEIDKYIYDALVFYKTEKQNNKKIANILKFLDITSNATNSINIFTTHCDIYEKNNKNYVHENWFDSNIYRKGRFDLVIKMFNKTDKDNFNAIVDMQNTDVEIVEIINPLKN